MERFWFLPDQRRRSIADQREARGGCKLPVGFPSWKKVLVLPDQRRHSIADQREARGGCKLPVGFPSWKKVLVLPDQRRHSIADQREARGGCKLLWVFLLGKVLVLPDRRRHLIADQREAQGSNISCGLFPLRRTVCAWRAASPKQPRYRTAVGRHAPVRPG